MSLRSRIARAFGNFAASWGWQGGYRSASSSFSFDGAKIRGDLRSVYGAAKSFDYPTLRARCREASWDSTEGGAILGRLTSNVIGNGLTLEYSPCWDLLGALGWDDAKKRAFCRDVELKWFLWATSTEPDIEGRRTFPEIEDFAFRSCYRDGDIPVVFRYSGDSLRMSPLSLQFLDPDQIDTPWDTAVRAAIQSSGNKIADGIETTQNGELVAIHVIDEITNKSTRIPVAGKDRRFVIFPALRELPGQVRGVGILAPIIHELQKITDYKLYELEAALVNAIVAAWIEPSADADTKTNAAAAFGGGVTAKGSTNTATGTTTEVQEQRIRQAGVVIQNLKKGEKIQSFDTSRPNVNFEAFCVAVAKPLAARLNIPYEVLLESFNANYSASRAALILWWKQVEHDRRSFSAQFHAAIFEAWFREAIKNKDIDAPYFGDTPLLTRAWLTTSWIGASLPSIDPLKDAQADDLRIAQGATTRERVAQDYNGSDFYDNAKRREAEEAVMPEEKPAAALARQAIPRSDVEDAPADQGGDE